MARLLIYLKAIMASFMLLVMERLHHALETDTDKLPPSMLKTVVGFLALSLVAAFSLTVFKDVVTDIWKLISPIYYLLEPPVWNFMKLVAHKLMTILRTLIKTLRS